MNKDDPDVKKATGDIENIIKTRTDDRDKTAKSGSQPNKY